MTSPSGRAARAHSRLLIPSFSAEMMLGMLPGMSIPPETSSAIRTARILPMSMRGDEDVDLQGASENRKGVLIVFLGQAGRARGDSSACARGKAPEDEHAGQHPWPQQLCEEEEVGIMGGGPESRAVEIVQSGSPIGGRTAPSPM